MSAAISGADLSGFDAAPGFHCVHPGYEKKKKEAERRETLFRNLRVIGRGSHSFRNALAYRRSTTALTKETRHP